MMGFQYFIPIFALLYLQIIETKGRLSDASFAKEIPKEAAVVCEGTTCPDHCRCSLSGDSSVIVDCSSRNLKTIPSRFPRNTIHIILYRNDLTRITNGSFYGCTELSLLNFYDNEVHIIEEDAFTGLPNLTILSLGRNQLRWFSQTSIPSQVFDPVNATLQILSLQHNYIWDKKRKPIKYHYRYDLTRNLNNLVSLRIDAQPGKFPSVQVCNNMPQLQTLGLYVWIQYIHNDTFRNFSDCTIKELEMKDGFMVDLEPLAFAHFPKLQKLDLSFNYYLGLTNVSKSWYGLTFTEIEKLNLTRINGFEGEHSSLILGGGFFDRHMCKLNLTELILDFNDILYIDSTISRCLPNLSHLSLKYNRLLKVSFLIEDIGNLSLLSSFDCSYQSMQTRYSPDHNFNPDTAPFQLTNGAPKYIDNPPGVSQYTAKPHRASHTMDRPNRASQSSERPHAPSQSTNNPDSATQSTNQPRRFSQSMDIQQMHSQSTHQPKTETSQFVSKAGGPSQNMYLYSHSKSTGFLEPHGPKNESLVWKLVCPPTLKTLILTESINVEYKELPRVVVKGECTISHLAFGGNVIPHFKGPVLFEQPPKHPVSFDIHDNQITMVHKWLLKQSVRKGLRVSKLNLNNNKLGAFLSHKQSIFFQFRHLEELHLADNQIKSLPWNTFIHLANLRTLNLSDNSLTEVTVKLGHMKNLSYIDLRGNMLTILQEATMHVFGEISANHALRVGLSQNPLACSCQSLDFLHWLVKTNMTVLHLPEWNQMICSYNAEIITMTNLTSTILPKLTLQCQSQVWLIATSVVTVGVILIIGLSVFLFRHRWEIRFCCLKLARQRRNYDMLIEDGLFKYDAFVAYSGEDRDWVLEALAPKLEESFKLKLYVYDNNAMIGTKIEENIVEGITKSRKTILVLSRNFVNSQWCNYEVEMARVRSFDEGRDLIVPVLLEDIQAADVHLNSSLLTILRRYVFLEWPAHPEDHPQLVEEFWDKLKDAVQSGEQLLRCECGRMVHHN